MSEKEQMLRKLEVAYEMCQGLADLTPTDGFRAVMAIAREYISATRRMAAYDKDFVIDRIQLTDYEIRYVAEKLSVVFGMTFNDPDKRAKLFREMGWPEKVGVPSESSHMP